MTVVFDNSRNGLARCSVCCQWLVNVVNDDGVSSNVYHSNPTCATWDLYRTPCMPIVGWVYDCQRSAASCSAQRGADCPPSASPTATDHGASCCVGYPSPLASLPPAEQARSAELDTRADVCEAPGMNSAMGSDSHFCRAGV